MKAKNISVFSVFIIIIAIHFIVSIKAANFLLRPDISAFYYAANVVLDPNVPNEEAYDINTMYSICEDYGIDDRPMPFVYSIATAYIMSPIVLMPYGTAKVVWNLLNIMMYVGSLVIMLYLGKVSRVFLFGFLSILLLWMPFVYNQVWLQSNALIVFLIALAIFAAVKDRLYTAGCLIGIASLFKLLPLAFAFFLGLKNWRISVACVVVFILSFFIPGSLKWFSAVKQVHPSGDSPFYTPFYVWLNHIDPFCFYIYAIIIIGFTVLTIYRNRAAGYPLLITFAVPAAFLVSPLVNYHHLTILALPYAYILTKVKILPLWFIASGSLSFLLINSVFRLDEDIFVLLAMIGLLMLWLTYIIWYCWVPLINSNITRSQLGD